ncbi:hypothetical protein SLE2022_056220 [Rubroshorea leprosula]
MLLQDSVPHSWSEAGQQDAPLSGLATQIPASSECFMFAPPYILFELINQNNLVPSLSTLHTCVPEYSSNSHACPMTIGPAPRIMIYFQSVLFPTFKPSIAAPITKTTLHLNSPRAYPEEERVLRPLRLISTSSSYWNTKISESHWISTGGSHGRSRLLFPSHRYEEGLRRRPVLESRRQWSVRKWGRGLILRKYDPGAGPIVIGQAGPIVIAIKGNNFFI